MTKEDILENKLNEKELEQTSGGNNSDGSYRCQMDLTYTYDKDANNCVDAVFRWIYKPSFPNCAATVEDGSHCRDNDACYGTNAIQYRGLTDCIKAWR